MGFKAPYPKIRRPLKKLKTGWPGLTPRSIRFEDGDFNLNYQPFTNTILIIYNYKNNSNKIKYIKRVV